MAPETTSIPVPAIPQRALFRIASRVALLQLVGFLIYAVTIGVLGPRPQTAKEFFELFQATPLKAFCVADLPLVVLVGLYLGTFPALYVALKKTAPVAVTVAVGATLIAILIGFANDATFSLWHLAERYGSATTEGERQTLLAAGEAVLAAGWWKSTNSYLNGLFLQGSGALISVVMFRSASFGRVTAVTGLLANGLDLVQHLLEPFVHGIQATLAPVMGPLYLVWFALLARDFARLARAGDLRSPAAEPARDA